MLLVVLCHCAVPWCPGGFVGVDVFFVLSGYLMTGLLSAEYRSTSRIDLISFYARRARRLLPACALALIGTVLAAAMLFSPQAIDFTGRAARWTALYVSNVFFDRTAADYFAADVGGNPLLHTWSLGVEEQFYLLWPALVLALASGSRRGRAFLILGVLAVLSFAGCLIATRSAPTFAFYELPARAWEFAAGGMLALLPASARALEKRWVTVTGIAGLAAILATGGWLRGGAGFPGWIALAPVGGTLAALHAGALHPSGPVARFLGAAPLKFIGVRSYSWYLWHWPFVVFAAAAFPGISLGGKLLAALGSLLVASVTFQLVERPVRRHPRLVKRPRLSLGLAAGVVALTVAVANALVVRGAQLATDAQYQAIGAATTDVGDLPQRECVNQGRSTEVKICEFGTDGAAPRVVLFGDSHAIQWFNALRSAATAEHWRLVTLVKAGCPSIDIERNPSSTAPGVCAAWRAAALDRIVAMKPAALVLANYTGATVRGFGSERPITNEELRDGARRTLAALDAAGILTVVLRDSPLPPFDVPGCVARRVGSRSASPASCDFDAATAANAPAFAALKAAGAGLARIAFLDLNDAICTGSVCHASRAGVPLYRDDNHLTGAYAGSLAPVVRARLFAILKSVP